MATFNVVRTVSETVKIEDLGYRSSSYILRINNKIFEFPTEDEAWDYIQDIFEDSGE